MLFVHICGHFQNDFKMSSNARAHKHALTLLAVFKFLFFVEQYSKGNS